MPNAQGQADMDQCWEMFGDLIDKYDGKSWNEGRVKELKEFTDHLRDECEMEPEDVEASRRTLDAMMRGGQTIEDDSLRRQVRLARITKDHGADADDDYTEYDARYLMLCGDDDDCSIRVGYDIQEMVGDDVDEYDLEIDEPRTLRIFDLDRPNGWWNVAFECEVEMKAATTWKGRKPDGVE